MGFHSITPTHRREAAEREIETLLLRVELLIARLDAADPDPDLEEDDPDEEHDGAEREEGVMIPVYGLDQSRGPVNVAEANRAYRAAQLEEV